MLIHLIHAITMDTVFLNTPSRLPVSLGNTSFDSAVLSVLYPACFQTRYIFTSICTMLLNIHKHDLHSIFSTFNDLHFTDSISVQVVL